MVQELEVVASGGRILGKLSLPDSATVKQLKSEIAKKWVIAVERQSIRPSPKGRDQPDTTLLTKIPYEHAGKVLVKDLGPQIGWNTVFFLEYAGPIFVYGLIYLLPKCFYSSSNWSESDTNKEDTNAVFPFNLFPFGFINRVCGGDPSLIRVRDTAFYAGILWTFHYGKRIFETAFVHRFSHGTMPIFNLFKNCGYYWGFALYIAYHVNHPLHTPPPAILFYLGCIIFIVCELGNLSIHLLLRDLRPEGTTVRKIPLPNGNPLTLLFNYVSCPNYTYEFGSWVGFTLLTGCLPVFIFALAGLYQMSVWAIGKHKKYLKEFPNYPKQRKAILPFII